MFPVHVTSLSQGSGPYTCRVHSLMRERLHLRVSSHRHTLFLLKILSSHHKQLQEFFHHFYSSSLSTVRFLLANHYVQGPRFEDLKENRIVEECPCQISWILGLTLIMIVKL